MKKIFRTVLTGLLVTSFALTGATNVSAKDSSEGVSNIVAFGDSGSDNGQAQAISRAILELPNPPAEAYEKPGDLYWEGRYSNGKTGVEVLADMMDVPLTNYAVGGAKSNYVNYSAWMDTLGFTGMLGQVDKYIASLDGEKADATTLHYILIGGNDYSEFLDYGFEGHITDVADDVVANIETAVRTLAEVGAKKFLISNAVDMTLVPYEITEGRLEHAEAYTKHVNKTLPKVLKNLEKELDLDITVADTTKAMQKLAKHPEKHGIKYVGIPVQPTYPQQPLQGNPDEYMSFDEWHFTAATNRILGEAMYEIAKKIK